METVAPSPTVTAVNALTARWASRVTEPTVLSGIAVWPLLGFMADAAGGPARAELAGALGVPAERAAGIAGEVLASLRASPGVRTAVGLWTREVTVRPAWRDKLPPGAHGELVDQAQLDAWASENTGGLIPRMPVTIDPTTLIVLAMAMALKTRWHDPFTEDQGPGGTQLQRWTTDPDTVRMADSPGGPLTLVRVSGTDDLDVHVVLGEPGRPPGDVLATGVDALAGRFPTYRGVSVPRGAPGVTVTKVQSMSGVPSTSLNMPAFTVEAFHDLAELADVFGLTSALDSSRGHFPGISESVPLAVSQAAQSAVARFLAEGFEAAAVTAMAFMAGSAPREPVTVRHVAVEVAGPFGTLAVDRRTGLILTATWQA